ncbi:sine oculis-binding protein homolog isoform X1 [Musca domestica]|uniref:Sine oculis-binding protein homolog isoform X1 n=2 Tax=Musca domestica TaxID=7370 RepID=A0ABM3VGH3_MUSDO|nr:sine oculis-binding protein homolog isoform X1 [Musca domestica]XP_058984898.1 sine oculis-binding protein homolog isoform X1 [Musca domestica]
MSTKTSSLNASANSSPNSPMSNSGSQGTTTPTVVKIKKELPSDEIKEFAENTMNELLGWYGFDSVDRLDISAKTSKLLQTAGLINAQQQQHQQHQMERRRSRSNRANALMQIQQQQQQQQNDHLRTSLAGGSSATKNNHNSIANSTSSNNNNNTTTCSSTTTRNNYRGNDSTASDHDTRSSRDDDSKSPHSTGLLTAAPSAFDEKSENCCWCRRPVPENAPEFLTTSDGPRYCSESCFTQSRRASFKKAKTCDWCKHIRHAVSYVDFHDGATQLQFCSDKCLNQYKMQIFCKETQAHLDMNPHLKEQGLEAASNGANLITPDLWLKNCRSRSASPASTVSTSPIPSSCGGNLAERPVMRPNSPLSPPGKLTAGGNNPTQHSTSVSGTYKPLISVAPVSKLMSKSPGIIASARQSPKHNRKKRPLKACPSTEVLNNRPEPKAGASGNSCPSLKPKSLLPPLAEATRGGSLTQNQTPSLTQFAASCVQDLHMNVPPLSPMLESPAGSQPSTPHNLPPPPGMATNGGGGRSTTIPTAFFATPPNLGTASQAGPLPPPPMGAAFPPRPPPSFMATPGGPWPRFLGNFMGLPQAPSVIPPDLSAFNALVGTPPPVTVMVPYPVIIPLPIPIPVPLPVVDFYKAYMTAEERQKFDEQQNIKKESAADNCSANDEPLDFTKTKECCQENTEIPNETRKSSFSPDEATEETREEQPEEEPETSQTNTTTNSPSNEDGVAASTILHCVISSASPPEKSRNQEENSPSATGHTQTTEEVNADDTANEENNQRLPKLKITRLQTKRTLIQTKESECSRPLRKRKRIIDCDFQKIATTKESFDDEDNDDETHKNCEPPNNTRTTTDVEIVKGQQNNK